MSFRLFALQTDEDQITVFLLDLVSYTGAGVDYKQVSRNPWPQWHHLQAVVEDLLAQITTMVAEQERLRQSGARRYWDPGYAALYEMED